MAGALFSALSLVHTGRVGVGCVSLVLAGLVLANQAFECLG